MEKRKAKNVKMKDYANVAQRDWLVKRKRYIERTG
jgi:hypothetical protein